MTATPAVDTSTATSPVEPTTAGGLTEADLDAYAAALAQEKERLDAYRAKLVKAAKKLKRQIAAGNARSGASPSRQSASDSAGSSGSSGAPSRKPAAKAQARPARVAAAGPGVPSPRRSRPPPRHRSPHPRRSPPPRPADATLPAPPCEHEPVSTYGLDGVLPWQQARHVASHRRPPAARHGGPARRGGGQHPRPRPLVTVQDDPPADSAAVRRLRGLRRGPWLLDDLDVLTAGWATPSTRACRCRRHADAVIALDHASVRQRPDGRHELMCHDPLTGIPDERVRPDLGEGIVRQGTVSQPGHALVPAGAVVTPGVLAAGRRSGA